MLRPFSFLGSIRRCETGRLRIANARGLGYDRGYRVPLKSSESNGRIQEMRSVEVVVAVVVADLDFGLEEVGEMGGGQQFFLRAVGDDLAVAQQDYTLDLGDDFGNVVRDQQDS